MFSSYNSEFVNSFFRKLDKKVKKEPSKRDINYVFRSCLDLLRIPIPEKTLYKYFLNKQFIQFLLSELAYKGLSEDERRKYSHLIDKFRQPGFYSFIQFRELDVNGYYPNITIARKGARYVVNQGYPILITSNHSSEYLPASEVAWITRNELKFATAVSCSAQHSLFNIVFSYPGGIRVDYEHLKTVPATHRTPFLAEWARIKNYVTPLGGIYSRAPKRDISEFEFGNFEEHIEEFNQLYRAFNIRDQLLMRTSSYFVKAILLWNNPVFGEDAISNVFFCLEGCLFLIQRKHGNREPKFNESQLKMIFINNFFQGDDLFEFIKEAYEKRISIVHPLPRWGADWSPFLLADDYYEYLKICKLLLNYILVNRIYDDF